MRGVDRLDSRWSTPRSAPRAPRSRSSISAWPSAFARCQASEPKPWSEADAPHGEAPRCPRARWFTVADVVRPRSRARSAHALASRRSWCSTELGARPRPRGPRRRARRPPRTPTGVAVEAAPLECVRAAPSRARASRRPRCRAARRIHSKWMPLILEVAHVRTSPPRGRRLGAVLDAGSSSARWATSGPKHSTSPVGQLDAVAARPASDVADEPMRPSRASSSPTIGPGQNVASTLAQDEPEEAEHHRLSRDREQPPR